MSVQELMRGGTKAENDAFTGAEKETVFDTENSRQINHDGSLQGGYTVPHHQDIHNQAFTFANAGGTATAITASTAIEPTALVAGMKITLKMDSAATGAATLTWGSLVAKDIKFLAAGVKTDPVADIWVIGDYVEFIYDGVDFIALVAGGGGGGMFDRQVFTSSGTWTKPAGTNKVKIIVVAGGGGGCGLAAGNSVAGNTGGSSSFGSHASATGGGGGGGQTFYGEGSGGPSARAKNSLGGIGSDGDENHRGQAGGAPSSGRSSGTVWAIGGNGGASHFGGGGASLADSAPGNAPDADGYGGGGGGAGVETTSSGAAHAWGGGGGGSAVKFIYTGIGSSETVTVGSGGSGGNSSNDGGNGAPGIVIVESYK